MRIKPYSLPQVTLCLQKVLGQAARRRIPSGADSTGLPSCKRATMWPSPCRSWWPVKVVAPSSEAISPRELRAVRSTSETASFDLCFCSCMAVSKPARSTCSHKADVERDVCHTFENHSDARYLEAGSSMNTSRKGQDGQHYGEACCSNARTMCQCSAGQLVQSHRSPRADLHNKPGQHVMKSTLSHQNATHASLQGCGV